ncbi:Gas vesicle structural protein [Streptomyces sp. enrichment culture]|uniref:gas vesicle protein n=1 Tax=Streptomyces sp. enrichment culture TaxID=1795815 RepID=UPI003F559ED3
MTQPDSAGFPPSRSLAPYGQQSGSGANLADILERVLDKGIVIVGDIKVNLLDIELLTIKLRLLVASVDKAKEIGIDWWEHDPALSSRADNRPTIEERNSLEEQNEQLRAEVRQLRKRVEESDTRAELPPRGSSGTRRSRDAEREPGAEPRRPRRKRSAEEGRDREP